MMSAATQCTDFGEAGPRLGDIEALMLGFPACTCCEEPCDVPESPIGPGMKAIMGMLRRPWFGRLWVVQETSPTIVGNVTLHLGRHWSPAGHLGFGLELLLERMESWESDIY